MPLFNVDVEKRLNSEFWSNRYIVRATDLADANTFADAIVEAERAIHSSIVTFTRYRVSSALQGDGIFNIVNIGLAGLRAIGNNTLLPLFNTLRVDLNATAGRPSRKYYRGVLTEADIAGDAVTADFQSLLITLIDTLATGSTNGIVDPDDQLLLNALVHPFVQMRQLRRSRRRRTNGGGIFQ